MEFKKSDYSYILIAEYYKMFDKTLSPRAMFFI